MTRSSNVLVLFLLCVVVIATACTQSDKSVIPDEVNLKNEKRVLIFSKTAAFRHASIDESTMLLTQALNEKGIDVVNSESSERFNDNELSTYSAIVFLNTTGDVLDDAQQIAMERYIQAGGGFVGIHAAADTEHEGDWFWYRRLVGGVFAGHPGIPSNVQSARINTIRKDHPSTENLPDRFLLSDEWYDFSSLSDRRTDLLSVDENSYQGGAHGPYHPIAWHQEFDGGRAFYTGIGHEVSSFQNPLFMQHLLGGIVYAMGENVRNYSLSRPHPNRFVKETLLAGLNEPLSLDITKDGKGIIFIERKGKVHWFDTDNNTQRSVGTVPVYSPEGFGEFGLVAVALDPVFSENQHVYMMYNLRSNTPGEGPVQRVSRFTLFEGKLDLSTEIPMIDVANEDTCCHTGGNMEFDAKGRLYIALGDNTNPFDSFGVGPMDFRANQQVNDALRSSGNTQDYRGKILRIKPEPDGSYSIPSGNLFEDPADGKPEIYVMGTRNPYTIGFDDITQTLYFGDIGPDARAATSEHGAKGHDEINRVREAGNFGWPSFIANNKAYRQYDYDSGQLGSWYDPLNPINPSPNNTGSKALPPAQGAYLWYPYARSALFPELKEGGRNALVAGVYRKVEHENALPDYYDGALFISDFVRRWVKAVFSDDAGDIYKIEDFAPEADLVAPLDLKFSHQGQLYILEYGSKWHTKNDDARLSRINYTGPGNRPPISRIITDVWQGKAPLDLEVSAQDSVDPDNEPLSYVWQVVPIEDGYSLDTADFSGTKALQTFEGEQSKLTLEENGQYALALTVTDQQGATDTSKQLIEVGNSPASIVINIAGNQSFFWPDDMPEYDIRIEDAEDGLINADSAVDPSLLTSLLNNVDIRFTRQEKVDLEAELGHQLSGPLDKGRKESEARLCIGCHQEQVASVGPAFQLIADTYASNEDALDYLIGSIAAGSSGKWGQHQMPAHDFLSKDVLTTLSRYILALRSPKPSLPLQARLPKVTGQGSYVLSAKYTDQPANGLSAITTETRRELRSPLVVATAFISHEGEENGLRARETDEGVPTLAMYGDKTAVDLGHLDLRGIATIKIDQRYWWRLNDNVELILKSGSPDGPTLAKGRFDYDGAEQEEVQYLSLDVSAVNSYLPVYLIASILDEDKEALAAHIHSFEFIRN